MEQAMSSFYRGFCNGILGLSKHFRLHHMLVDIIYDQYFFWCNLWSILYGLKVFYHLQSVCLNTYRPVCLWSRE